MIPKQFTKDLISSISKERLVRPTVNNIESSRSHIIIHIQIVGNNVNPVNLFIGDFAGVENKFQPSTADSFLQLKINNEVPFYKQTENIKKELPDMPYLSNFISNLMLKDYTDTSKKTYAPRDTNRFEKYIFH